jgi:hypothetical protein
MVSMNCRYSHSASRTRTRSPHPRRFPAGRFGYASLGGLVLALVVLSAGTAGLAAEPRALVLGVTGQAHARIGEQKPAPIKRDTTLPAGVEIRTGKGAQVTLQLSPTLLCRIGENSTVKLDVLSGTIRLNMQKGSVGTQAGKGTQMQIATPTAIASVRGTEFIVETESEAEATVLVNEGTVAVENEAGQSADVEAGNKVVADAQDLKLSIMEQFEKDKFAIFEEFKKLKKQNYDAYLEQVRRNEELREQMRRPLQ